VPASPDTEPRTSAAAPAADAHGLMARDLAEGDI
jgi:hypothetical protein